jgi:hypothetical protein
MTVDGSEKAQKWKSWKKKQLSLHPKVVLQCLQT